jgi:hypothetical protein
MLKMMIFSDGKLLQKLFLKTTLITMTYTLNYLWIKHTRIIHITKSILSILF